MKYSLVLAAAITGAFAASMENVGYGAPASSAAVTTPAAQQQTSTVFATEIDTIISCGSEITNCPGKSTTPVTTAPATTKVLTTSVSTSTSVKTSTSVLSTTPVATSTPPKTTAPATSQPPPTTSTVKTSSSSIPPPPPVTLVSTQAIETCVPTTIYHTITIVSTTTTQASTTPVATSKPFSTAPYGTAPGPKSSASGTGAYHVPTNSSPPIATGAAGANSVPLSGMAIAAAAYLLF